MLSNPVVVGGKYRTADGKQVRIYATDGYGNYPVHGAMKFGDGWDMRMWRAYGSVYASQLHSYDLCEVPDAPQAPAIDWTKPVKQRGSGKRIDEIEDGKDYTRYRIGKEWYSVAIDGRANQSCESGTDAIQCAARPWAGPADVPDECEWMRMKGSSAWHRLNDISPAGFRFGVDAFLTWINIELCEWTDKRSNPARECVAWE